MANEATILKLNGLNPIIYSCDESLNISKGALLTLSGDYTVGNSSDTQEVYAGVAAADHVSGKDGTTIAVHVPGQGNLFDMTNNGSVAITLGAKVVLSAANLIAPAVAADLLTGAVIGTAEEAASTSEVIRVLS